VQFRRNLMPASLLFDLEQDLSVNQVSLPPSGLDEDPHAHAGLHRLTRMEGHVTQFIHNFHPPGKIDPPDVRKVWIGQDLAQRAQQAWRNEPRETTLRNPISVAASCGFGIDLRIGPGMEICLTKISDIEGEPVDRSAIDPPAAEGPFIDRRETGV